MDVPRGDPGDVLVQPTRARLFGLLGELKRPAGTEELARRVGLHVNGVRLHLERLHAAGLVLKTRARQSVGRPRDEWEIDPGARPGGGSPSAYADLGRWLVRSIEPSRDHLRTVEAAGREIGREIAPRAEEASAADAMQTALAAMGFAPERRSAGEGSVVYCLGNCPYREAARQSAVVCTLHQGLTQGLLDVLAPTARLSGFVARDPDSAGCEIELEGVGAPPGA